MGGQPVLVYVVMSLLVVFNAAAVVLVLLQLPGTWLLLGLTALAAWWQWDYGTTPMLGWWLIGGLVLLAVAGEAIEFVAGPMGARKSGGSKRGAVGAMIGGVGGAILGTIVIPVPVIGTIVGACLGAGLGSVLGDRLAGRSWKQAADAGTGAAVGRLFGTVAKTAIAAAMWLLVVVALFVP